MNWRCSSCGLVAKTNRQKCRGCGGKRWRPEADKESSELGGPMRRIVPRGLLLAAPAKQAPIPESGEIECGSCHGVIYKPDNGFDAREFQEAKEKHYSLSPACKGHK